MTFIFKEKLCRILTLIEQFRSHCEGSKGKVPLRILTFLKIFFPQNSNFLKLLLKTNFFSEFSFFSEKSDVFLKILTFFLEF